MDLPLQVFGEYIGANMGTQNGTLELPALGAGIVRHCGIIQDAKGHHCPHHWVSERSPEETNIAQKQVIGGGVVIV